MNVADVLPGGGAVTEQGGQELGEGGQPVSQQRLVPPVYCLTDPVLPQPDVHHVQLPPQHAGHHGLAVAPHQTHQAVHLPLSVVADRLHQPEVPPEVLEEPGAGGPGEVPHPGTVGAGVSVGGAEPADRPPAVRTLVEEDDTAPH